MAVIKPIVHYKWDTYPTIRIGFPVVGIIPVDHPVTNRVTNTKAVMTSPVLRIGPWGEFETKNTIYRALEPLQHDA